jgi:hypothetical protein
MSVAQELTLDQIAQQCAGQDIDFLSNLLKESGWIKSQESYSALVFRKSDQVIRVYRPVGIDRVQALEAKHSCVVRRVEGSFYRHGVRVGGLWSLPKKDWTAGNGFYVRTSLERENALLCS